MSLSLILVDRFHLCGVIKTKRKLTSEKNKNWAGYILGVAGMGATHELEVVEAMFNSVAEGEHLFFSGEHENYAGKIRLKCQRILPADRANIFASALDVVEAKDKVAQGEALRKFQDSAAQIFALK